MVKYSLNYDDSKWRKLSKSDLNNLSFADSRDRTGEILIGFCYENSSKEYRNPYVNIPLTLSELELFLQNIMKNKGEAVWVLGFAPFAYGRLENESLLISSRSGADFSKGIYDVTDPKSLRELIQQVSRDIQRCGRMRTIPELRDYGE